MLLPLGLAIMIASWVALGHGDRTSSRPLGRGDRTAPRVLTAWAAGWYMVAVLGATFLPLRLAWGPAIGPPDFYRITLIPLITMRPEDFVLNTAMMLPLAVVLRLVFGVRRVARVVLIGFLISAGIELTQGILDLTLHGDRWADVNDLMSNTLGALLGALALARVQRWPAVRRWLDRCSLRRVTTAGDALVR